MSDIIANGRPSDYSEELANIICERIVLGESVREIGSDPAMPDKATIYRWIAKHQSFRDNYARAKSAQADVLFDELLDIADDGKNDWMERRNSDGANIGWIENGEALRRSALRVDTRKWIVSKLLPKKYGEKLTTEISGPNGSPILVAAIDLSVALKGLPDEDLEALERIAQKIAGPKEG